MDRPQQPYLPPYEQSQAMHNSTTYGFVAPEGGYPHGPEGAPGAGYPHGPGAAPGAGYPHGPVPTHGYSTGPPSNPNYPQPTKEGHYPGTGDSGRNQPTAPSDPGYAPPGTQYQQPQFQQPQFQQPQFQQPQFQQQQFVGTTTLVAVPVMVAPGQRLGPQSCPAACPKCGEVVRTTATSSPNMLAWMSCSVIAILGCFWGCCLIPFCLEPCQDVHHSCPRCNTYIGKYSRLS